MCLRFNGVNGFLGLYLSCSKRKEDLICIGYLYWSGGPVTKLKNLSDDIHSILLGAVENDFQLVIQKESYESASDL